MDCGLGPGHSTPFQGDSRGFPLEAVGLCGTEFESLLLGDARCSQSSLPVSIVQSECHSGLFPLTCRAELCWVALLLRRLACFMMSLGEMTLREAAAGVNYASLQRSKSLHIQPELQVSCK